MMTKTFLLASIGILVFGSGCLPSKDGVGDKKESTTTVSSAAAGPAPKGGSCKQPTEGVCTEFAENPLGASETLCTSMLGGTYSKDACARENLLGTCATKEKNVTYYYFGNSRGPLPADAKGSCSTMEDGTFTVAPGAEAAARDKAMPSADRIAASCIEKDGSCVDFVGSPTSMALNQSMCDGTWQAGKACATEGVLGSCVSRGQVRRYTARSLKASYMTLADVEKLCNTDGFAYEHFFKATNAVAAAAKGSPAAAKPSAAKAKK